MPSRILRDWTDSLRFDGLSAEAERLFTRLIMKADDYGRFHADPRLLRAGCFPLSENLRMINPASLLIGNTNGVLQTSPGLPSEATLGLRPARRQLQRSCGEENADGYPF